MSELPNNPFDQNQETNNDSAKSEKMAESIGVLIQKGGVAHFRDIVLNTVSPSKKQWLVYGTVLFTFTVIVGIFGVLSVESANQRRAEEALILNRDTRDDADPNLLPVAKRLIEKADAFSNNGQHEKALNHYRKIIDYSIEVYKNDSAQVELTDLQDCSGEKEYYYESYKTFCDAQNKLVLLIERFYLPILERQIRHKQIGAIVGNTGKQYEEIFSEGALRTTYSILVREGGIWADEDNDGFVNTKQESLKLPCSLLRSIEELWEEYARSKSSCGWYNSEVESFVRSPDCSDLEQYTLTDSIFLSGKQPVTQRLKECKLAPNDAIWDE